MGKRAILLLGNYPPPYGGVPSHVRDVSAYLSSRGWDVHVVPGRTARHAIERPESGVTVYRLNRWAKVAALALAHKPRLSLRDFYPSWRVYLAWYSLCVYCLGIIRKHDIAAISAYHLLGNGTIGAWLAAETGRPLITTIFGEIYSDTEQYRTRKREIDFVARYTAQFLSCSEHCARSAALLGAEWPVRALHYGVDIQHFRPDGKNIAIRRRFGWSGDDPVVIFVGRLHAEMGLDVLLETIPRIVARRRNARFLIVGSRGPLAAKAENCRQSYTHNVVVLTDAPYDELPEYYRAATVAVAPSVDERACLGLAVIEAMACGRAVIGSDIGGTPEVIVEGETGFLVRPRDPSALADRLLSALSDLSRLDRMGVRARQRAVSYFDKDIANNTFESLVIDLMNDRNKRPRALS